MMEDDDLFLGEDVKDISFKDIQIVIVCLYEWW